MRITFLLLMIFGVSAYGQNTYLELGGSAGSSSGSAGLALHKNWGLGANKKFLVGTGVRLTSFFGKEIYFTSAPNSLATVETSTDSLFAPKPSLTSLNAMINLGYAITNKIEVGFNIDALGFSFGPTGSPNFISNGKSKATAAKPTALNVLLVGNNDRGSLNSHFYGKLKLSEKFGVKLAYQFLFNELTTSTKVQTLPEANDRFRFKSSMVYLGVNYSF